MNGPDIVMKVGACEFRVFSAVRYCETVFADGSKVPAAPQDTDTYRARARELGYGDNIWAMCLEHELFHTLWAVSQGFEYSQTLWDVAHGLGEIPSHWMEEQIVMDLQRTYRGLLASCPSNLIPAR